MFIDTSILIEIICRDEEDELVLDILGLIKDRHLFISEIQIGEISDWCLKFGLDPFETIDSIKEWIKPVELTDRICIMGSILKMGFRRKGSKKFSLIDGIILASARSMDLKLLTLDNDFFGNEDVIVLDNY